MNISAHMWMIGMANCRLHIFTFSNGMLRTRFKRTLSSFDVNCLLFYVRSHFYGSGIEQSTHTEQQQRKQKKIILDAWNLQSRLSCSETKEIKYRRITRERKKPVTKAGGILCAHISRPISKHISTFYLISTTNGRHGKKNGLCWISTNCGEGEKVYSRLNEVVNGWLMVNLYQTGLTRSLYSESSQH